MDKLPDYLEYKWYKDFDKYYYKRINNKIAWTYALITTVVWTIVYYIYVSYKDIWMKRNHAQWAPNATWFGLGWIVVHYIIGYVVYKAHIKYRSVISDLIFAFSLLLTIVLYIVEFVDGNRTWTIILQSILFLLTLIWMGYLLNKGLKEAWLLVVYLIWIAYLASAYIFV